MKQLLPIAVAIAIALPLSCTKEQWKEQLTDAMITSGVSVATDTALRVAIKDDKTRTEIAAYICGPYATGIRSITGNPTPENFLLQINSFIPDNIKQQYPELIAFVNPLALNAYQVAYNKYGNDVQKVTKYLNDIATGLQQGACH